MIDELHSKLKTFGQEHLLTGIETLTPDELARMNLEWGERAAQADEGH